MYTICISLFDCFHSLAGLFEPSVYCFSWLPHTIFSGHLPPHIIICASNHKMPIIFIFIYYSRHFSTGQPLFARTFCSNQEASLFQCIQNFKYFKAQCMFMQLFVDRHFQFVPCCQEALERLYSKLDSHK